MATIVLKIQQVMKRFVLLLLVVLVNFSLFGQYAKVVSKDNPETAIKVYDIIIDKEPTTSTALNNAGVLHFNLEASNGAA